MPKETWIIASILSALFVAGIGGVSSWSKGRQLAQTRAELAAVRQAAEQNQAQLAALKTRLDDSTNRIAELEQEKAEVTRSQQTLEQEMRAALQSKDITISELQGKLTVSILDRVLFDSGEAELKPEGEQVMRQIARVLAQYPNRQVHVIGHTDNVPIRAGGRGRYASNWELSTARATAAVRYLAEQAAVDPRRLGAVGYGEFHPLADNATPEGRARNRRIAVVVLSEELAGADAPASAPAPSPTPESTPAPPPAIDPPAPSTHATPTATNGVSPPPSSR